MNEKIKEILEGIKVVIKYNGTLEFDAKELKILLNYITNLRSNWNSLREWFKYGIEEYTTDDGFIQNILKQGLDKMNKLEGADNENN